MTDTKKEHQPSPQDHGKGLADLYLEVTQAIAEGAKNVPEIPDVEPERPGS